MRGTEHEQENCIRRQDFVNLIEAEFPDKKMIKSKTGKFGFLHVIKNKKMINATELDESVSSSDMLLLISSSSSSSSSCSRVVLIHGMVIYGDVERSGMSLKCSACTHRERERERERERANQTRNKCF